MKYGDILKKLRKKKNLSQQDLSDRLKINRSTYARYEMSATQPDFDTLKLLADFYNVTVDYILGRTDNPSQLNKGDLQTTKDKLNEIMNELPEDSNFFFFDMEGLSEEDIEMIKQQVEWLKKKAKEVNDTEDN